MIALQPESERIHLCVPDWEREQALAAGATASSSGLFVIGRGPHPTLARWMPNFDVRPDPIPPSSWYDNVRSAVSEVEWTDVKRAVFSAAGRRCRSCGGRGDRWPVECHEEWSFDERRGIQKLERFVALCPACHEVKHIGLAQKRGRYDIVIRHMAAVTGIGRIRCGRIASDAISTAVRRSRRKWTLDLTHLDQFKVSLIVPEATPSPAPRPRSSRPDFGRRPSVA